MRSSRPATGRCGTRCCPAAQIDFLDADLPVQDAVRQAWEHAHSRYPVTDGSPDKVIGFVHVRDMLDPAHAGNRSGSAIWSAA